MNKPVHLASLESVSQYKKLNDLSMRISVSDQAKISPVPGTIVTASTTCFSGKNNLY